ncbi:MAG: CPBP family intramembrane metalloprotease [Lachnospiraceae bacterium]|nr:CPBP family intramembrane metalloprotease [Lachnospiraceae bacterium]
MRKPGSLGKCFMPIIMVFLVENIISIMGVEFLFMIKASSFQGNSYTEFVEEVLSATQSQEFAVWVSIAYAIICGIWFSVWYYQLTHNKQVKADGINVSDMAEDIKRERKGAFEGYRWTIIPGMILLAIGAQYVCSYIMNLVASLMPQWLAEYQKLMEGMGLDSMESYTVPLILYTVVLGPIVEELTFRGLTFTYARRLTPFWVANIIQAVLFGVLHMNPLQGIYAAALGIIFGMIYEKSRNILVTIVLHMLFNIMGVFVSSFMNMGDNAISFYFILLGSLIVTYIGYELVVKSIPQRVNIEEKIEK